MNAEKGVKGVAKTGRYDHLWERDHNGESLIPLLQQIQEKKGYISGDSVKNVSRQTGVPESEIYGVMTFYTQFRLKPLGKNLIKICDGTACHVNDSKSLHEVIVEELHLHDCDTTDDGLFTLQRVACLGCCSLAPVIMINDETYGRLTALKVRQILREYRRRSPDDSGNPHREDLK